MISKRITFFHIKSNKIRTGTIIKFVLIFISNTKLLAQIDTLIYNPDSLTQCQWICTSDSSTISLVFYNNGGKTFYWSTKSDTIEGKYAIADHSIWFLMKGKNGAGEKWDYKMTKTHLYLSNPEDFLHKGNGNYLYYQMTNPKKSYIFKSQ